MNTQIYQSFIKKYQPSTFDTIILEPTLKKILDTYVDIGMLNILFVGDSGCGKTTTIQVLLHTYFENYTSKENILYINNLKEQGIHSFRQELKAFVQTSSYIHNKKKIVVIDDIDTCKEDIQQIIRNCIDNYSHRVQFIASCSNIQKVLDSVQSRLHIFKLSNPNKDHLMTLLNNVVDNENIILNEDCKKYLVSASDYSYRVLLNYLEKLFFYQSSTISDSNTMCDIKLSSLKNICTNIKYSDYELYCEYILKGDWKSATRVLFDIYNSGYSVIDILENLFLFLKTNAHILHDEQKYMILPYICKYISIFHSIHEEEIELYFFTYEIVNKIFRKNI